MSYIVIEGLDGLGKSTLIRGLQAHFTGQGKEVRSTRAQGGDGTCDFQNAARTVLLHDLFPVNEPVLEERLFNLSDSIGTAKDLKFLQENENSIVIKDRGLLSHFCYSLAKGKLSLTEIVEIYQGLAKQEDEIGRVFGNKYVVLLPNNREWLAKRIRKRSETMNVPVNERLEGEEFQNKVFENFKMAIKQGLHYNFNVQNISILPVSVLETDDPGEVLRKTLEAIEGDSGLVY